MYQPVVSTTPIMTILCRLCGIEAEYQFELQLLGKYSVTYYKCRGCGALQTEEPYWLEEAYGIIELFDTGKASRTLDNFLAFPGLLDALSVSASDFCVDFGGGSGLFARLMRDVGYSFYSFDKYGSSEFATAYVWKGLQQKASLVTLFEVAEHFAHPSEDWGQIFSMDPEWVIGSTAIYQGQGADWGYLAPLSGQHVFFYTPAALAQIAQLYGRSAYFVGGYFLIAREPLSEFTVAGLQKWQAARLDFQRRTFESWLVNPYQFAVRDQLIGLNALM